MKIKLHSDYAKIPFLQESRSHRFVNISRIPATGKNCISNISRAEQYFKLIKVTAWYLKKKKLLEIRGKVIPNNFDTQVTLIIHPFFSFTRDNIYNRACARRRLCQRDNEALHKGGGKSAGALQLKWMRACMRYARVREASGSKIYRGNDIVIYRYITRYGPLPWCYGLNWKSKLEEDWICLRMETCSR